MIEQSARRQRRGRGYPCSMSAQPLCLGIAASKPIRPDAYRLVRSCPMATRRRQWNLALIALAAIVGAMSWAEVASACSEQTLPQPPRSCCPARVSRTCNVCCEAAQASPSGAPVDQAIASSIPSQPHRRAASACVCPAERPTEPASRPEPRPTDDGRPEWVRAGTMGLSSFGVRPPNPPVYPVTESADTPGTPLYLCLLHLLN